MDSNMKLFAATPSSKVNCKRQRELARKYAVIISKANSKKTEKRNTLAPVSFASPFPSHTEWKYNLKAYKCTWRGRKVAGRGGGAYVVCCLPVLLVWQSINAAKHTGTQTRTHMHTQIRTHMHTVCWVSATFEWALKASDLQINQASIVFKMPTNPSRASCELWLKQCTSVREGGNPGPLEPA